MFIRTLLLFFIIMLTSSKFSFGEILNISCKMQGERELFDSISKIEKNKNELIKDINLNMQVLLGKKDVITRMPHLSKTATNALIEINTPSIFGYESKKSLNLFFMDGRDVEEKIVKGEIADTEMYFMQNLYWNDFKFNGSVFSKNKDIYKKNPFNRLDNSETSYSMDLDRFSGELNIIYKYSKVSELKYGDGSTSYDISKENIKIVGNCNYMNLDKRKF